MESLVNDESLVKYYWLGFLLADGSFESRGRIKITLAAKDKNHLQKLQKFLQIQNMKETFGKYPDCTIAGMDSKIVKKLCKQYSIVSNKTENPPILKNIQGDKLKALGIGFIDGDGSICRYSKRSDAFIRVKLHKSWINLLNYIYENKAKINKQGYAEVCIAGFEKLKNLKRFGLENELPLLERKWDKINLFYVNRLEKRKMKDIGEIVGGEK